MNLNPLKKDDNTDALVKALEDANNVSGTRNIDVTNSTPQQTADNSQSQVVDDSVIASDPQITGAGMNTTGAPDFSANNSTSTSSDASGITFDGNDLPAGLSSDANAHVEDAPKTATELSPELDGVKKSALEQLRPLIDKLDLEPADKFDKYLMMLRASDDPALIKPAFDAAQGITGEKQKAQALLDIINEINYITANQAA